MPASFAIPLVEAQIYLPLHWTIAERQERRIANYLVLGRLKNGVSLERAGATSRTTRTRSDGTFASRMSIEPIGR
jgi:hypothetical protein